MAIKKLKNIPPEVSKTAEVVTGTQRAIAWVQENPRWVSWAAVLLVAVLASVWGLSQYRAFRERGAGLEYARILVDWPKTETADDSRWQAVSRELESFLDGHGGTSVAFNARLDLLHAYFGAKRYEDAIRTGRTLIDELPDSEPLKPLAQYQLAVVYQAAGQGQAAIELWHKLLDGANAGFEREIRYYLAGLYADQGDLARAADSLEKAIQSSGTFPVTALLEEQLAQTRVKLASPPDSAASSLRDPPGTAGQGG